MSDTASEIVKMLAILDEKLAGRSVSIDGPYDLYRLDYTRADEGLASAHKSTYQKYLVEDSETGEVIAEAMANNGHTVSVTRGGHGAWLKNALALADSTVIDQGLIWMPEVHSELVFYPATLQARLAYTFKGEPETREIMSSEQVADFIRIKREEYKR